MDNNSLYFKMLRKNFHNCILLVGCNAFVIMVLCFFANLLFNDTFMNPEKIDPLISSNVYAPTVMTFVFSVFFISYSHFYYYQKREKEYGILAAIGVDYQCIVSWIVTENIAFACTAYLIGFVAGIGLSVAFVSILNDFTGLQGLSIKLSGRAFRYIGYDLTIIYMIIIVVTCHAVSKKTIKQLVDSDRKRQLGHLPHPMLIVLGILFYFLSGYYAIVVMDQNHNNYLMLAYGIALAGVFLITDNIRCYFDWIRKKGKNYYKKILFYTDLEYRLKNGKKMLFLAMCLISIALFLQTISVVAPSVGRSMVKVYHPKQIAYAEMDGYNALSEDQFNRLVKSSDCTIKTHDEVAYFVSQGVTVISKKDAEKLTRQKYEIPFEKGILLLQFDEKDGYPHDNNIGPNKVVIETDSFCARYDVTEKRNEIAFGQIESVPEMVLVINNKDFNDIMDNSDDTFTGLIHMIDCEKYSESVRLEKELISVFTSVNGVKSYSQMKDYRISTQHGAYLKVKNFSMVLKIVFTLFDLLLFVSCMVMIHFKIVIERGYDQKKNSALFRLGFTEKERYRIIKRELDVVFLVPTMIATLVAGTFTFGLFSLSNCGLMAAFTTLLLSVLLLVIEELICVLYSRHHFHVLQKNLQKDNIQSGYSVM